MKQMESVEQRLRQMILDLEIGPGDPLSERGLEKTLGASRTPVRTALQRLESGGLVRREGRGWIVAPLDLRELEQLLVYREVLELAALRLAAPKLTGEALENLTLILDSCGADSSLEHTYQAGLDFHLQLARLSENEFLVNAVADTMTRLSRARWMETDPTHPGWDEHRSLLSALGEGKVDDAVKILEVHLREHRERILALLRNGRRTLRSRGVRID